ncbi:MAG: UDP-3-O-(3-hydroxymyristoyl)glucosamine N-acyltransferase [Gemmataceae bacterium]|nr:UDP-3-O-(3-hydroxymyristoyl)glucosamine N-acyltransferase [Gemmataceae bacterium]MDW8265196.1 UDP-3-O-(3-hydroxymyristoyl)glucosamine N-acyltransferase [Gemmataceae bacterium]
MNCTVGKLAALVQGEVEGEPGLIIQAARSLSEAGPGDITFLEDAKYLARLRTCQAAAVVVGPTIQLPGKTLIRVPDPLTAFVTIVRHMHGRPESPRRGIDPRAAIDPDVQIGPEPSIYPFVTVGEGTVIGARCRIHSGVSIGRFCRLGDDVVLYPNVVLYDGTVVGDRTIVHANAVIGADGFGYRLRHGRHVKVPQLGHVEIGADVEIGACTTVDRGTFQATRIGDGTKVDNLVQIAHNCRIGRHNILVSQVGIAGSSSTGDYVVIAGQAGINDHVHIGDRAVIGAKAGVVKSVPAGTYVLGAPAMPEREQKRILLSLEKLPEIRRHIRRIMQHLGLNDAGECDKLAG